ncbi:hypothetical protein L207DRAFT_562926 [Hyaloscypha variabilis F]|uniref:Zn(2)-C6 fungal-type domain-containing protein n=1 Tax=Hyaloscypha variabilis (strain UAMH 11265 / GT02V1 / F) TaxID=1149755 RepID=A0A2J6S521_HYAVF|nr:hypothetical protein L207DRAFT_562926 [Hyaloscypha variabilis F]
MSTQRKTSACVNCRQMKLKCDAQTRFPASCTRCAKQKLHCSIDPTFKRTPRRQRITEMEKELEEIKASMASKPDSLNQDEASSVATAGTLPFGTMSVPSSQSPEEAIHVPDWTFTTQSIDEIELQPAAISELLQRYWAEYHPIFPILPDLASFATQYNSCELLFWTIVAISSRYSAQYAHLYLQLKIPLQRLATDISKVSNEPLSVVQALLLICWWPYPFAATKEEPSWTYCGLATHFALQHGMHRPHNISDFHYQKTMKQDELILWRKTWLGCFITNQLLSSHLGVPSTIPITHSILDVLGMRPPWLPPSLEQYLKVAYQNNQASHSLGNDCMTESGLLAEPYMVIDIFDKRLKELELQARSQISPFTEITILKAKLQLYSFAFNPNTAPQGLESAIILRRREIFRKAASCAMKLIEVASSLPREVALWNSNIRLSIGYAVFFLLELSPTSEHHHTDELSMRNSISQAWNLFRGSSTTEYDHEARQASIIEYMSRRSREGRIEDPDLTVKSRMAANITYDIAWRAKERFSQSIRDARPSDYTTAAAIEEFFETNLDFQLDIASLGGEDASWNSFF